MLTRRTRILADRRKGRIVRLPGWQKPPRGTLLDRSHPLARGLIGCFLLNEGTGYVRDLITGLYFDQIQGTVFKHEFATNVGGMGYETSYAAETMQICTSSNDHTKYFIAPDITNFVLFTRTDDMTNAGGKSDNRFNNFKSSADWNAASGWYMYCWSDGSSDHETLGMIVDGANGFFVDLGNPNTAYGLSEVHSVAISFESASNSKKAWFDGVDKSSSIETISTPDSITSHASYPPHIQTSGGYSVGVIQAIVYCQYIWNRQLSNDEIQWLHAQPYAMFQRERRVSILTPLYRFWPEDVASLRYTRGNYSTLPTDDADLEDDFEGKDYEAVEADDNVYVLQSADGEHAIFEFKEQHTNRTDPIAATWKGKTTKSGGGRIIRAPAWQKPYRGTLLDTSHPLARGLIAAYIYNEYSGSMTANLASGNYHLDTWESGPVWQGGGVYLSGANSQMKPSNPYPILWDDKWTIATRMSCEAANEDEQYLLEIGNSGQGDYVRFAKLAYVNYLYFYVYSEFSGFGSSVGGAVINNGLLQHLTGVRNGVQDHRFYKDGVETYVNTTNSITTIEPSVDTFSVGADVGGNYDLKGRVEYVYVWNRNLLPAEVYLLHAQPYAMFQTTRRFVGINPVYLQVFNHKQQKWVTIDTENNAIADEEFTLEGSLS